jgi:hypothetical protein
MGLDIRRWIQVNIYKSKHNQFYIYVNIIFNRKKTYYLSGNTMIVFLYSISLILKETCKADYLLLDFDYSCYVLVFNLPIVKGGQCNRFRRNVL